jgi:hypothetical protein
MKREHSPQRAACAASRWRLRFLTDPLPTPEPSNRTAKINMPFAESTEPTGAGLGGGRAMEPPQGAPGVGRHETVTSG